MKSKPQHGNKNDDNDSDVENLAPQPVNEVKISVRKLYKYCCIYCSVCRGCTGKHTVGDHTIQFGCTPFSLGEKRSLDCQYGVQYKKVKTGSDSSNQKSEGTKKKKRVYLQGTRKKGCAAHIQILEFNLYPEYSVDDLLSEDMVPKQVRMVKEGSLKSLREALQQNDNVIITRKYYISLPTEDAHHSCHPTKGMMGFSQRIHPELITKIQEN